MCNFAFKETSPRKSDLKRGRFVDKNREPATRLKRNDSLTKKEKETANARKKEEEEKENNHKLSNAKALKTLANQKRVRRRHTVGGTKDFGEWEKIVNNKNAVNANQNKNSAWSQLEPVTNNPLLNVNRSLETWLQTQQKIRASSPDLTGDVDARRLSLPDSMMSEQANAPSMHMPSLLESQV